MKTYRQGDVLILVADPGVHPGARLPRQRGRIVLAEGEVTGHAHAIASRGADLHELAGLADRFLRVLAEGGVALTHEEHDTITIPVGDYIVRRQREYHPQAIRIVSD